MIKPSFCNYIQQIIVYLTNLMWNTVHKVHKGSFLFPSRINKLNYILYHWGRQNLIILAKLCEQTLCLSFHFCSRKPPKKEKKKKKNRKSPPPYLPNAYRQSSDTKASSACVYRAAAATLDPESQWAHRASDAHLFQSSQRTTKQQTLIPM